VGVVMIKVWGLSSSPALMTVMCQPGDLLVQSAGDESTVGVGELKPPDPRIVEPPGRDRRSDTAGQPICSAIPRPIAFGCTFAAICSSTWDWANRTDSAAWTAAVTARTFSNRAIRSIRAASATPAVVANH
jgi:hypothetical protein